MAYCDYNFYTSEYLGNVIAEADFPRIAQRASDKLDRMTFGRLEDGLPDALSTKVKKAVCAMSDNIYDIEVANATIRQNGGASVSSVSSGSESISYRNDFSISEKELSKALYSIASDYLHGTGLLYAGF